jgi:hypothetical protein
MSADRSRAPCDIALIRGNMGRAQGTFGRGDLRSPAPAACDNAPILVFACPASPPRERLSQPVRNIKRESPDQQKRNQANR